MRDYHCPKCGSPNLRTTANCTHCGRTLSLDEGANDKTGKGVGYGHIWTYIFVLAIASFSLIALMIGDFIPVTKDVFSKLASVLAAIGIPITISAAIAQYWAPRGISIKTFLFVFLSGGSLGIIASLILYIVVPTVALGFGVLLVLPIIVGAAEELGKMSSLTWLVKRQKYTSEAIGFSFGIVAGLGFAALENTGYILIAYHKGGLALMANTFMARILTTAVHAIWTGSLAAIIWRERRVSVQLTKPVLNIFLIVVILHAFWDFALLPSVSKPQGITFMVLSGICSIVLLIVRLRSIDTTA